MLNKSQKGSGKKGASQRSQKGTKSDRSQKSGMASNSKKSIKKNRVGKKKPSSLVPIGKMFETKKTSYMVNRVFRNPGRHAEYNVTNEGQERVMRIEPSNLKKLYFTAEILLKAKDVISTDTISQEARLFLLEYIEYNTLPNLKINYLIVDAYGIHLEEVRKVLGKDFTPHCALNIAVQTFEAIKILHDVGYVNRNIRPATFSVGCGAKQHLVYMSDFRITRVHIDSETKKPKPPRKNLLWLGTPRFASIAAMQLVDQGRKDDLESWVYMMHDLFSMENGITWKKQTKEKILEEKIALRDGKNDDVYKYVPDAFKKILKMVHSMEYDSTPDYNSVIDIFAELALAKELVLSTCDWTGKLTTKAMLMAIVKASQRTSDNQCGGFDDFEVEKKRVCGRKIMNTNDCIINGPATWKVECLLGSGGFGDVYKVMDPNEKEPKSYALKTENESGEKQMLRLKVELQVMQAIQEDRKKDAKTKKHLHFVEFLNRGRSEELKCKFVVMSLVGPSLDDCRKKYNVDLARKATPYIIGVQTLEAVADLHSIGFLHRDIKPANFAVGLDSKEWIVYMLDFGICRSFLDLKTKQHKLPRKQVKFLGTIRFASRACMKCADQGRKDDLESWLYMIFDILDEENGVSWKGVRDREKVLSGKESFFLLKTPSIFDRISQEMKALIKYINSLQYESLPNYEMLKKQLYDVAKLEKCPITDLKNVEWVGQLKTLPCEEMFEGSPTQNSTKQTGTVSEE